MKVTTVTIIGFLLISNVSLAKEIKNTESETSPEQMEFLQEQLLLKKKLDMCSVAIENGTAGNKGPCKDAIEFEDYLTEGDGRAYFEDNLKAGNMDNRLIDLYLSNMKKLKSALSATMTH